jgi:hypothetical protein
LFLGGGTSDDKDDGFTIGTHLSCLEASATADAVYGPGFKDLNEVQKYYVYNAPYTAAVTGEDVIDKLRSEYEAPAAAAGAEHA